MEEERSLILDIVGDEPEAPRLEVSAIGSSSEDSSGGGSGDDAVAKVEDIGAVYPGKSARSYDFRASTVTMGCIRQLESLGYFTEGSARESGEQIILKPADNNAVVFEEFFTVGLRMLPHLALTDILVKF
jgi:acetylornithine deacetylase/succinyl-diaminopimelate desuccinylase-like protein